MLGVRAISANGVSYPIETVEPQRDGCLGAKTHTAKWVGGAGEVSQKLTRGWRINVPNGAVLTLTTEDPIR